MQDIHKITARSLISRLRGIAEGLHGWYGIAWKQREDALRVMLAAADAEIVTDKGMQHVVTRQGDRLDIKGIEHNAEVLGRVANNAQIWLRGAGRHEKPSTWRTPCHLDIIAQRMGSSGNALLALARAVHTSGLMNDNASLTVHGGRGEITATYVRGKMTWRNGRVTIADEVIPETIRRGLANRPLSTLVDDPVIGDIVIRTIGHVDIRERRIRIITEGAG